MCHLPYNCHLHSQWARLRHTKVACHIHVSFVPALTETRRSGILTYFISHKSLHSTTLLVAWDENVDSIFSLRVGMRGAVNGNEYREHLDMSGYRVDFGWRIFPGHTLREIQIKIAKNGMVSSECWRRLIFISILSDVSWDNE